MMNRQMMMSLVMTVKALFNNMKISDEVETCSHDCYFKLKINDTYKYFHK